MAGDNRIVTENFLRLNFTPQTGITAGTDDLKAMSCVQIRSRYKVGINGGMEDYRCPGQNQIVTTAVLTFLGVMTPNNDGTNDTFFVTNLNLFPVNHMKIWDQGGTTWYEVDNYQSSAAAWNGKKNNTGALIPNLTVAFYGLTIFGTVVASGNVTITY
jgi:gliding motility-associated-like protein